MNNLKSVRDSFLRNKGRTFLSVLGVVIGISTVIIVFSTGEAIKAILTEQVNSFGADYVQVEVKVPSTSHTSSENAVGQAQGVAITTLTLDDAEAMTKIDNIRDNYGGILSQDVISYFGQTKNVFIFGVGASFDDIDPGVLDTGRFFTDEEDGSLRRVVVLGSKVAEDFFGDDEPVGQKIKINKVNYEVIGVFKSKGANLFFDQDSMVYAPVRTVQKQLLGVNHVSFIFNRVYDNSIAELTSLEISDLLRDRHKIDDPSKDDFAVTTRDQALGILGTVTGAVSILLLLIGSISLLVGGIGIMNIMFVSVNERTYEIGLRKAIGATQKNIRDQFLTEAVAITTLGGVIGVIIGILFSLLIALVAGQLGFAWPFVIKLRFLVISIGAAGFAGLIAGYYPAKAAAKLDPIVALGKEI